MAYCTITEVKALNPKRTYDTSSTPTQLQVESFITRIGSEIDSALSLWGITTPVTSPVAFVDHLKQLNAYGAAALAEMGQFPEMAIPGTTPHGSKLWQMYKDGLAKLEEGKFPIGGIGPQPTSFFEKHEGEDEDPHRDDPEWQKPKFGKDKTF
jgi:hypothetical protein